MRSSAWSASPARARPPSAPRCSATPAPARSSRRARCCSRTATSSSCRGRRSASCAARRSPTCRRTRPPRSTRASGSASSSSSSSSCAASAPPSRGSRRRAKGSPRSACPNDDEFLKRYAHQLSGGQVQRVALAMAFLPKPKVLVLDEPTTGLDVTTQKMVLDTMAELCRAHGVSALYVTHDLAVVANIADRVAVMYAGQIAELGPTRHDLRESLAPLHPGAARLDPAPEPGPRAEGHPGPHAGAGPSPGRLQVQRPLRVRDRPVPRGGAGPAHGRAGARRALPPGRRDRHLGHQPRHRRRRRP